MPPLRPWMSYLLYFAGTYNLLVMLTLLALYHEALRTLGIEKPNLLLFVQLVGILVGLFGVGYLIVARNPVENRNVLLLGFLSKFLGTILGLAYFALGKVPVTFLVLLIFSDIVYLPPFWIILRRLYRIAGGEE